MSKSTESGKGPLFTDPDCERARQAFRNKPRVMVEKVMSVREAVARFVADGDYLASGGFGADRIATAALHEIVRQRKQDLGFAGHTTTHDFQILCAGNQTGRGKLLSRVDAAYIVGLEARGLSAHARRVSESGEVVFCEWSNYTLAARFQAAAMGVPFLPVRTMAGTDTFEFSAARTVECPFTFRRLTAVPALWPDVSVIHVHESDVYGNCRINGNSVADVALARASKKLIITCERLIPNDEIRRHPTQTMIPFFCVDAVCEVPFGSYPGNMPYEYFSDEDHLQQWLESEKEIDQHMSFLSRYVFETSTFAEYLELCGGVPRMQDLRRREWLIE